MESLKIHKSRAPYTLPLPSAYGVYVTIRMYLYSAYGVYVTIRMYLYNAVLMIMGCHQIFSLAVAF